MSSSDPQPEEVLGTADSGTAEDKIAQAVRDELDQVVPHLVTALKRNDAVADLSRRLDAAEKRLSDRQQRPLIAGVRRVLTTVRRLEFDPLVKSAILAELEGLVVGAGYTEFGEVGEPFDPSRHEAVAGEAGSATATVVEIYEPGLETLGEIVVPAKVRVGDTGAITERNSA